MGLLAFSDAVELADSIGKKRHVLLGNGFSIACRSDCFTYGRLLDEAELEELSVDGRQLFAGESTTDFERVIRALTTTARLASFYETSDPDLAGRLNTDAEILKTSLATALAHNHPNDVYSLETAEYESVRRFLSHFNHYFTLNYDLLLYWAMMHETEPAINCDDGFRADLTDPEAQWVAWDDYKPLNQNVFFLHGGLHLYAQGATLKKLTFSRTGIPLVDQIRSQLDDGAFPLIVTEGSTEEKHARIINHAYLAKGLRSLATCRDSLFVHGHSLDPNDDHILTGIVRGSDRAWFVSIHGSSDGKTNRDLIMRASALAQRRPRNRPLQIHFYDAESAHVWS